MVRQGQEQQVPTPIVFQTGQQRGLLQPQAAQVGQVGKAKPQIVIKQTVKQIQQSKGRRRDKKVRFANKNVRSKLKKEYTQAKKQLHKELMTKKKLDYEKQNDIIKKLPAKQRKGARVKLRATLSKKMKALKSALLPLSRLKNPSDIEAAIKSLKKIKW
jgi:thioredoxin-like negative regulator of GroEL